MGALAHSRNFRQALKDRIIVHDREGIVLADPGYPLPHNPRQIEYAPLLIAGKILRPPRDRAVLPDDSRTADAHHRSQRQVSLGRRLRELTQHTH